MTVFKITAAQIIGPILKKAEREQTCKLRLVDIEKDPRCPSVHLIRKVYPDPQDAIRAAGLYPSNPNDADLVRSLWKFYQEENRLPQFKDARDGLLLYNVDTYKAHLSVSHQWHDVLVTSGLVEDKDATHWRNEIIAEALVQEMICLYGADEYLPTQAEHDRTKPLHNSHYIVRYVGGWEQLSERTGLPLKPLSLRSVHSNQTAHARPAAP